MRTVWLASYPKSGNTWLRMLIANLSARDGEPFDINVLAQSGGIASAREPFDDLLLIDSGLLTFEEIDRLRPQVYEAQARGERDGEHARPDAAPPVRFVKVHDAYTLTSKGMPLLAGKRGADAAILIARDPRDIVSSLAHHRQVSLDAAIAFLADENAGFCAKPDRQHRQFRQHLPGWSGHAASWLAQKDIPVHLVRYEDLQADTAGVVRAALAFAGQPASEEEINRAVEFAGFTRLQEQERAQGFREAPRPWESASFFRRGVAGGWRHELSPRQVARVEAAHAPMMQRLGYELSTAAMMRTA